MLNTRTDIRADTTTAGNRERLNLSGKEGVKLPSVPGEGLRVHSQRGDVRQLLEEFKDLYQERLRCIQLETDVAREELLQKKVDILQSYVADLTDQNQVLAQTVEDLQREADHQVSHVGMERCTSDGLLEVSEDQRWMRLEELVGPAAHITHRSGSLVWISSEYEDLKIQLQTKNLIISDLERELRESYLQRQQTASEGLDSSDKVVHLQTELSCLQQIHKENTKEIAEKDICITKLRANIELLQQDGSDALVQLSELSERTRELQEELKKQEEEWNQKEEERQLRCEKELKKSEERRRKEQQKREEAWRRAIKEERKAHTKAARKWAKTTASLNAELQTSESMRKDVSETLDKTRTSLQTERQQKQQIQDQLDHVTGVMEHLQQELAQVQDVATKTIHKKEDKIGTLLKEVMERKRRHAACQSELLQKQKSLEKLSEERDELRAKMDERSRECVHLSRAQERLEADLALSHEKLHTFHLEVRSRDQLILQLRAEMKAAEQKHQNTQEQLQGFEGKLKAQEVEIEHLHQQLKGANEELKEARLQKETVTILKQKYTAAIEKVHRVQGRVELLEEELRYSQQQLTDSQLANRAVKAELTEMTRRFQEKVVQWENSQEALDQLTDELQANQILLRESQQEVDALKQQTIMSVRNLKLYQQSHSHSDDEYLRLLSEQQQLQQRCALLVDHHAECERVILQMKSELQRQSQETAALKQTLVSSKHAHTSSRVHLEQEVKRLKEEVAHLKVELVDNQKVHAALLRQSEEELKEARREVDVKRGELEALRGDLQKEEEKTRTALREMQSLRGHIRMLRDELEEIRKTHRVTVDELAARAEEARRMEGRLSEGKLAEEKMRSVAMRMEMEAQELRRDMQHVADQKLELEREKEDAQEQVEALQSELEGMRSNNTNLRHESQLVMTNVNRWITEQKDSNKNLTAQMRAQNKVLLILTEEKEHLQEANDTLNAEVKRLKEAANEKEREIERFKAKIRDQSALQDHHIQEKQRCVAQNLDKMEDMQTRLQINLKAIGTLNQQLNTLSRENRRLRGQLEEERSMRRPADKPCSSVYRPPPPSASLPSSLHHPPPQSSDTATTDLLAHAEPGQAGPERPGESHTLGGALRRTASSSVEKRARSGRMSGDVIK